MWSSTGFEAETYKELVEHVAEYHAENDYHYKDDDCLVIHSNVGENCVSKDGVNQFNQAVNDRIDYLKYAYKECADYDRQCRGC